MTVAWIHAGGRTDMTVVTATYCNYSNVSKNAQDKKYVETCNEHIRELFFQECRKIKPVYKDKKCVG
jgi:hypothetical protein